VTATFPTGTIADGAHVLAGRLRDGSGKSGPFQVHFTVWNDGTGDPPPTEGGTSCDESTSITSSDGTVVATMPAGAYSPCDDVLILRVDPGPAPGGIPVGFSVVGRAVDVTARRETAGTQVHHFLKVLTIAIGTTETGLLPATSDNGQWRLLRRVPQDGQLPDGWDDGYFMNAGGVQILTRHLSSFALLRDVAPPTTPTELAGTVTSGNLSLSWKPGIDNSGAPGQVRLYTNGAQTASYPGTQTSTGIGPFNAQDTRGFQLAQVDDTGNLSAKTKTLRGLPPLVGQSLSAAKLALTGRGFVVGHVATIESDAPEGTVVAPTGVLVRFEGSTVDLVVSSGQGSSGGGGDPGPPPTDPGPPTDSGPPPTTTEPSPTTHIAVSISAPKTFVPGRQTLLGARVKSTRPATGTVQLFGKLAKPLGTWPVKVHTGTTVVLLKVPKTLRAPGLYSLSWHFDAADESVGRTVWFNVLRAPKVGVRRDVVLAAKRYSAAGLGLAKMRARGLVVDDHADAFDLAGEPTTNVTLAVMDVDELGLGYLHDFHSVFPLVRIVALADTGNDRKRARDAGATVAFSPSTPVARVGTVVRALLARR
jgi:hypothetical protein